MKKIFRKWLAEAKYRSILGMIKAATSTGNRQKTTLFLPTLVELPPGERFLSLAPHPDDDVLACGGTLNKLASAGKRIVTVVLTDGASGKSGSDALKVQEKRREEAIHAAEIVGVSDIHFLCGVDNMLRAEPQIVRALAEIIEAEKPDLIFLPFPLDYHPDHLHTSDVLMTAYESLSIHPDCYCYECVCPIVPNRIVEISNTVQTKIQAMEVFASQMDATDYVHTIPEGLNRFRTHAWLQGVGYAEGFFSTDAKTLRRLSLFL